jgi:hypothetical protein
MCLIIQNIVEFYKKEKKILFIAIFHFLYCSVDEIYVSEINIFKQKPNFLFHISEILIRLCTFSREAKYFYN